MKVVLFGATGMIGQGVLRECLLDDEVEAVLSIARRKTGLEHPKLREIVHQDFTDFSSLAHELSGYDACLFCLGVSSVGMSEDDYRRVTLDTAVAAGKALLERNPGLSFVFVSGMGSDSTERGGSMWARVKGAAENALLAMPFKGSYVVRPAIVQPEHGATSRATITRIGYALSKPLFPVVKALFPKHVTTLSHLGRAMLHVAKHGAPKRVLENVDILAIGRAAGE